MVNFKKILVFITVICLFFSTPMTLRAETNIGVNPEQVAPPPKEGPNVFSQFATTIDAKTEDILYDKNAHHGDFIFVGDIGRPDLLETAVGMKDTAKIGAKQLFDSIQKIKTLPDYLQIWPSHGAGSACGKALGAIPTSTLGYEKMFNWAFQCNEESDFVSTLLTGQPEPPRYFSLMKNLNKYGPPIRKKREVTTINTIEKLQEAMRNTTIKGKQLKVHEAIK